MKSNLILAALLALTVGATSFAQDPAAPASKPATSKKVKRSHKGKKVKASSSPSAPVVQPTTK